jgi:predicted ArsR family transcriptional regulator
VNRSREIIATAIQLAQRPEGTTAGEVAALLGASVRSVQKQLKRMGEDGLLRKQVPFRVGRPRAGGFRTTYRAVPPA